MIVSRSVSSFIALAALTLSGLDAADWYVAPLGSDANPGTQASPWQTIAKALTGSAGNDRVLLQRGGTWRETFTIGGGRQLLAYGTGADPEITASQAVTLTGTWTGNGNVRTAAVASPVLGLWVNGAFQRLARYPNKGAASEWLRADAAGTDANGISDAQLPARASGRWTGAQVRWRRWSWWWETRAISSDNGGSTLSLGANPVGMTWASGVGGSEGSDGQASYYYIDNDLDELDAPGEWFWSGGTLYVYPPAGTNPTTIQVATSTDGVRSDGATFTGIAFRRFQGNALTMDAATTVDGCTFEDIEVSGVRATWNSGASVVRNSIFRDIRNVAIEWWANSGGASGALIERNLLQRIGVEHGYGGSGPWHAAGVILGNGNGVMMKLNRVVDTGYAGVILGTAGQTVHRNVFARTMQTLNDGAAIYTNCNASIITENIVLDVLGDLSTSMPWWPLGHGIWPEFLSDFHDQVITDNTIYGCNGNGIVMDNEYTSTVSRNVIADCRSSGLTLDVENDSSGNTNSYGVAENADNDLRAQNHTFSQNIIAAVSPSRRIQRPETLNKWWLSPYPEPNANLVSHDGSVDYGTTSQASFVIPASGTDVFKASTPDRNWTTLANWTAANASWAQGDRLLTGNAYLLINDTESSAAMTVPAGTWTLHDGTAVSGLVTVAAFRSAVLITAGAVPSTPYTVASGIDWRAAVPTTSVLGAVAIAPAIATQPANRLVTVGQTATFTIAASGTGPLTIQWRRNGSAISGATGMSYTTPATTVADHGAQYSAVVSNSAGTVTSGTASLSVTAGTGGSSGGVTGAGPSGDSKGCSLGSGFTLLLAACACGLERRRRTDRPLR